MTSPDEPLRIANCSGFFGDRLSAAREQVEGGPIDVLTGDWLAELTMLILAGQRAKRPEAGYARTFVTQMEQVLGTCLERGIKVVSNAGGLNPGSCAAAVRAVADGLGLTPRIAYIHGDDLLQPHDRIAPLQAAGEAFENLDTSEWLSEADITPITANAYLGGFGIKAALDAGADVVITGRVTDAALVVGPAAWRFGWTRDDLDPLAGAVVAGHVIECGAQATGGNYSFFAEVPGLEHPGFPIAELYADGSSVITKHPGTGGLVSVGTVTAQLLYEIAGPEYANPDVIARFDTIHLEQESADRVRVSGTLGGSRPTKAKVAINYSGGFRNSMTFVLTGLDIQAKADLAERTLWRHVPGGREAFDDVDVRLVRHDVPDAPTNDQALAELRVTVKDGDEAKVGRAFSNPAIEMALASYPGFFMTTPPTGAKPFGVYWPALVDGMQITQSVWLDGDFVTNVGWHPSTTHVSSRPRPGDIPVTAAAPSPPPTGPTTRAPLGTIVGARSGDKGGNANVGLWARTDEAFAWLDAYLTVDQLRELLPEAAELEIERHPLANLRAVNFVIKGILGRGVADSTRTDAQAKGLGEYLRSRLVELPVALLPG